MVALVFLVGLPILEILLLIQAGSAFGFWPTVGLIAGTAALGIYLIRQQGIAAIRSAQEDRAAGEVPVSAILTGIRLAFAGILLVIPGFVTDAAGLLLLIPGVSRGVIKATAWTGGVRFAERGHYHRDRHDGGYSETIDAEFEVVSDGDNKRKSPSDSPEEDRSGSEDEPIILPPPDKGRRRRKD